MEQKHKRLILLVLLIAIPLIGISGGYYIWNKTQHPAQPEDMILIKLESEYTYIYEFQQGRARVELGPKCGFIDSNGKEVIPVIYDMKSGIFNPDDPHTPYWAHVGQDGKWGYIDTNGAVVIPLEYGEGDYSSGAFFL